MNAISFKGIVSMKPTIFFSHSSRDTDLLVLLRDFVVNRTNGTVDVFLSTDGESLAFGRSWTEQIVSKLRESSILFAFLSSHSLTSQWVFFEAGIAYERGMQVIPVGLQGVDIGKISPPLSSFQGFNLDSPRGLKTLLRLLNDAFGHRHQIDCGVEDYLRIFPEVAILPLPRGEQMFRVYTTGVKGERRHEIITINNTPPKMMVKSSNWESLGFFESNRYQGRFRFLQGGAPGDRGTHDFEWNGREFRGSAKLDSGRWLVEDLIWRPEDA